MRTWSGCSVALALILMVGCSSEKTGVDEETQLAVVAELKDSEKAVKDAVWTSPTMLKVGVLDDGTRRDGLARYFCQRLHERGLKGKQLTVQIVDIVKVTQGNWIKLGESHCA